MVRSRSDEIQFARGFKSSVSFAPDCSAGSSEAIQQIRPKRAFAVQFPALERTFWIERFCASTHSCGSVLPDSQFIRLRTPFFWSSFGTGKFSQSLDLY